MKAGLPGSCRHPGLRPCPGANGERIAERRSLSLRAQESTARPLALPLRYAILALSLALPAPALAADEEDDRQVIDLGEVEVTDQAPPPEPTVEEEPTGFGTVVETTAFEGQRIDVSELLLEAPGTRIHHAPGGKTLMLRGTSSDQSLVLLDGIPLNATAGGGVDLRTLPASLLEKVTVIRGNEGARYGAGALGGVALLQTRELGGETGGSLRLSAGSFDTYDLAGAVWGGTTKASGLAALTLRQSEGDFDTLFDPTRFHDTGDARREKLTNNDERGGGLLLKGRLDLGDSTTVHALTHGWLGERGMPGTLHRRDIHRRDERRLLGALRLEHEAAGDLLLFGGLELRHDQVAVWADEAARSVVSMPATDEAGKPWQIENALTARFGTEAAPFGWTLLRAEVAAGADWLDSPYHDTHTRERLALSLIDEIYLGDTVTVAPALRWDRLGDHEGLSPGLGAAWRPFELLELRANWGRTFRAPSFGELYLEQALVKANPLLDPEHGWTVDAGAVIRLPQAQIQLAGFYSRTEDLIVYEQVSSMTSKPRNVHDAEVRGGEIEAQVRPLRWLTLSAAYSLTFTRNLRDDPRYLGNELAFRPPHRLHGRVSLREGAIEAFAGASHQSRQYLNRANTDQAPAYTTFQTGAGVRLTTAPWALWLSAQVDNVFDALRWDQLGFPQPGRAFTITLRALSPGEDRRANRENRT